MKFLVHWRRARARVGRAWRDWRRKFGHWQPNVPRWLRAHSFGLTALLFAGLALIVGANLEFPTTITAIQVRTETLQFTPANPSITAMVLRRARLVEAGQPSTECFEDVRIDMSPQAPPAALRIAISREFTRRERLIVRMQGPFLWSHRRQDQQSASSRVFWVDTSDESCRAPPRVRIDLNGDIELGDQTAQSDAKFSGGVVVIYGRSARVGLPFHSGLFEEDKLYQAAQMTLPADSRIGIDLDRNQRATQRAERTELRTGWFGYAEIDLGDTQPGFQIVASTSSDRVDVIMPTLAGREQPDQLSPSLLARLGGDPNLQLLTAIGGLLLAVLAIAAQRWPW